MYCTICLEQNSNIYHNICRRCTNTICNNCYKSDDIHNLDKCPACRTTLSKQYSFDLNTLMYLLFFYKHTILHILINIIFTNLTFYYNFPAYISDKNIPQTKTLFLIILNYCNFIIAPTIYNSFKGYIFINYIYCFYNFIACQIINHVKGKYLLLMYTLYCNMYLYTLCIIHITLIYINFFIKISNHQKKLFVHKSGMYKLVIYRSFYDTRF
jgi:hypothetical protein